MAEKAKVYFADFRCPSWRENLPQKLARLMMTAGFGDIDRGGYLDRLYIHKCFQRMGIASALCDRLEAVPAPVITTHASITARGFFEKRGYRVVKEQQVERHGILLTNYIMESRKGEMTA